MLTRAPDDSALVSKAAVVFCSWASNSSPEPEYSQIGMPDSGCVCRDGSWDSQSARVVRCPSPKRSEPSPVAASASPSSSFRSAVASKLSSPDIDTAAPKRSGRSSA